MIDAAERLVNLALYLAAAPRPVTAEACRDAGLGYPDDQDDAAFLRMFERDKDALRAAGLAIEVVDGGATEAYRLSADATFARPVDFSSEEVSAMRAVAAAVAGDRTFPFRDDLALAMAKLGAGGAGPLATSPTAPEEPEDRGEVQALAEAVRTRKSVAFEYTNASGVRRHRTVDPYGLLFRDGDWYVIGRDHAADDVRTFAVCRIGSPEVNASRPRSADFEPPAGFDARDHERLPFQYGGDLQAVLIRFAPGHAWRAERLSRGRGTIEPQADGSALWAIEAADLERLASWIVEEGPGLVPVAPPALLDVCADGLRAVVAAHG